MSVIVAAAAIIGGLSGIMKNQERKAELESEFSFAKRERDRLAKKELAVRDALTDRFSMSLFGVSEASRGMTEDADAATGAAEVQKGLSDVGGQADVLIAKNIADSRQAIRAEMSKMKTGLNLEAEEINTTLLGYEREQSSILKSVSALEQDLTYASGMGYIMGGAIGALSGAKFATDLQTMSVQNTGKTIEDRVGQAYKNAKANLNMKKTNRILEGRGYQFTPRSQGYNTGYMFTTRRTLRESGVFSGNGYYRYGFGE